MSELNDDLLNYELGDDIDDQALYGADEDELLLSDDELEKDVTKEEKQQLKAEAEQWVQSQIEEKKQLQEQQPQPQTNGVQSASTSQETVDAAVVVVSITPADPNEVSSTAATTSVVVAAIVLSETLDGVSTSVEESQKLLGEFKEPSTGSLPVTQHPAPASSQAPIVSPVTHTSSTDEVTSSSSKELEMDHSSVISCSTSLTTDSSFLQSSQESTGVGVGPGTGDFSDPREDFEEEREERTNIKITNERDTEPAVGSQSPDKQNPRYMQSKRGCGTALLMRPHGIRGLPYHQRPLLRFPPHGNFPLIATTPFPTLAAVTTTLTHTSAPLIPGQFPPQQALNPYIPHTQHPLPGPPGSGPGPGQLINPNTQNPALHSHDPMIPNQPPRQRPPFPGYRAVTPMGFRHPNPGNMYQQLSNDYGNNNGPLFGPNFGHPSRAMFRHELSPMMQGGLGMQPGGMRPGMRAQRPPLQSLLQHNMTPNFVGGPPLRPQQPTLAQQQATLPPSNVAVAPAPAGQPQLAPGLSPVSTLQRPSKVLINPNFKGGVEAAKNKFIKETQFMSSIRGHVSHLQSDDELLRQQEEFINKNRQHIEKRRQERSSPAAAPRRSRSRSRTRSHSRERSYSPAKRGVGALSPRERHFERERERERERAPAQERFPERERERAGERLGRAGSRERERERERDRATGSGSGSGSISVGNRGNRFRRASSRDRDYENRSNYGKRRRSMSPNRGGAGSGSGRRGGLDRERNDVEEDEETRVYRLEIEKQKTLREKILRDKEVKRRRAAEEKLYEDKRVTQAAGSNNSATNTSDEPPQPPQPPQKLKPLIITERKIISLKKRQQQQRREGDNNNDRHQPAQRKQIPTAKILPEAKRTLTDHLTNVASGASGHGHGHGYVNTAIIKPVQKKDTSAPTTPPKHELRRLSTASDDEVELDYDEDELMLEDEERLLATPTPSPKRLPASRTPTPEPPKHLSIKQAKSNAAASRNNSSLQAKASPTPFASANRRVVLKASSSSSSAATGGGGRREFSTVSAELSETSRSRRGNSRHRDNNHSTGNRSSSSSKGIFERLDARKQQQQQQQLQASNEGRRKGQQRIVLKHHD